MLRLTKQNKTKQKSFLPNQVGHSGVQNRLTKQSLEPKKIHNDPDLKLLVFLEFDTDDKSCFIFSRKTQLILGKPSIFKNGKT